MAKPIPTRDFLKELRAFLDTHGIDVVIETDHGKGSHIGVVLKHRSTGHSATYVLAGGNEVSPGVQRRLGARAIEWAAKSAVHALAAEAFKEIFKL